MKAIAGVTLIDGLGSKPISRAVIIVENDKIVMVGHENEIQIPDGIEVIHLDGMTVLPGLIDAHIHLLGQRTMNPMDLVFASDGLRAARAVADLRKHIESGVTTVRECGSRTALAMKQALAEGAILGPRVMPSGHMIIRTGGSDDIHAMPLEWAQRAGTFCPRLADGADDCRKAVREQLRDGADFIKTVITGAITTQAASRPDILEWSPAELSAIVDEAHRLGVRVAVHAHAAAGIKTATEAGVDSIEHGSGLNEECCELMVKRGTWLVPTLFVSHRLIKYGAEFGTPDWVMKKVTENLDNKFKFMQLAIESGVKIAMGTDATGSGLSPAGKSAEELELMVEAGMSPMEAIRVSTSAAAACLGIEQEVGSIEPGKQADLIAVGEDPLLNIKSLQDVVWVMQRGQVVVDRL